MQTTNNKINLHQIMSLSAGTDCLSTGSSDNEIIKVSPSEAMRLKLQAKLKASKDYADKLERDARKLELATKAILDQATTDFNESLFGKHISEQEQ